MPTRTFPGTYGIELLWWHSVTNCFGDTHGVQSYGYIKKWEDFHVVFERNCQNRSVTPKTFNSNGYKNLLWYIRNITIMVAFRNKWFWGPPWGLRCPKNWEDFLLCTGTASKLKVLHQKPLVLMLNRTLPGTYGIELLWWHSVTNCFGDPHGVQTYGYIDKSEDFLWCSSATAKIEVLHQNLLTRMGTRIC